MGEGLVAVGGLVPAVEQKMESLCLKWRSSDTARVEFPFQFIHLEICPRGSSLLELAPLPLEFHAKVTKFSGYLGNDRAANT